MDDPEKYGMIKDNVFSLIQGLSARVNALDNEIALEQEMETVLMLTKRMQKVMRNNDEASMHTMTESIEVVEDLALAMEELMPFLSLELKQELTIDEMFSKAIETNQKIFSSALIQDEGFTSLLDNINKLMSEKVDGKVDLDKFHRLLG